VLHAGAGVALRWLRSLTRTAAHAVGVTVDIVVGGGRPGSSLLPSSIIWNQGNSPLPPTVLSYQNARGGGVALHPAAQEIQTVAVFEPPRSCQRR